MKFRHSSLPICVRRFVAPQVAVVGLSFALVGCGVQINALRVPTSLTHEGVIGVPPILDALTITDVSPTNHLPVSLQWGVVVGTYTQYCLLENSNDASTCVWHTGTIPANYSDSGGDGACVLTAFLKNDYGISVAVNSNPVQIDRTPPVLASAAVGNANPTNSTIFSLSYGSVTNLPYTQYCVLENDAAVADCAWQNGSLPNTYTVTSTSGAKTLSFWLQDAAGNVSSILQSAPVTYNGSVPTIAITTPAAASVVNIANQGSLPIGGTCSENGQNVIVSGAASATTACTAGNWSTTVDLSAAPQGALTLYADLTNTAGTHALQASVALTKDSVAPTIAISLPAAGSFVNLANQTAFAVSGTCSENGRSVVISGSASATVSCAGGNWSANLNFSGAGDGAVNIAVNLSDAAGNPAVAATRTFTKDTTAPTLAITTPAAGAYVTIATASSFAISGTCSENGRTVTLSGAGSGTAPCAGGAWSTAINVSGATDGMITVMADLTDSSGNPATQVSRTFSKDTVAPAVAITSPGAGTYVNTANVNAFSVSGTCSENGQTVTLSGAGSGTVLCAGGTWSKGLDVSGAADGTITIKADLSDVAGNPATQSTRTFTKDATPPTVAITAPAAGSIVNLANVTSFAVSGTCSENGQPVMLSGAGSATPTCTAHAWTAYLDVSTATDGTISLTANLTDAAGNSATANTRTFTKDTVPPTVAITAPAAGSFVNSANAAGLLISGTCSENGQTVSLSGAGAGSVACTSGTWSKAINVSGASEGTITVYVDLSDAAGNPAVQASRSFIKDTTFPTVAITSPAAGAFANIANVAAFPISGTCSENGQSIMLSGAGSGAATCTANAWSTNLNVSAAGDGTITVNADLTDSAGNASATASRNFTKDSVAPTVAITSPATGTIVNLANVTTFTVSGTCSENGRTVTISGAGSGTAACGAGTWSKTIDVSTANDGTITVFADLADTAGNPSLQASRTFTKSTGTPAVAITSPASGSYVTIATAHSFVVSGTCSVDGQTVTLSGSGAATPTCASNAWTANLDVSAAADGTITINANMNDGGGNPAPQSSRTFTKDTAAPTVAITAPAAASYVNAATATSFALSGTCSENGQTVTLSGAGSGTVACASGTWSKAIDVSGTADGTITVKADLSDSAGNPAPQSSRSFTKDTGIPSIAITSPAAGAFANIANQHAFTLSGTCSESGQTVTLSGAASATPTCTANAWTANLDVSADSDGSIVVNANMTDAAGNAASQATRSFTKDTVAASVAITGPAAGSYVNNGTAATFAVSGTCSDTGQNVVISGSGSATVTCMGGAWNAAVNVSAAGDGTITLNANHSDAAGNPATQSSRNFTKDTSAPTVAITSPAAGTYANIADASSFTVSGTCSENGQTVNLSGAGSGTVACASGTWSKNLDVSGAADGTITVTANLSDLAGNTATASSRSFLKDTAYPTNITISTPTATLFRGGQSVTLTWTCNDPNLSGTPVDLYYTTDNWTTSNTIFLGKPANGTYAWTVPSVNTSAFQIQVDCTDLAGNGDSISTATSTVDSIAPTVAITSPAASAFVNIANVTAFPMSGTCSENGQNVVISGAASGTVACASNAWSTSLNLSSATDGTVTLTINQSDAAGNTATPASRNFTKDTVAPTVAITSPAAGSAINIANAPTWTLSGTCSENGQNVVITGSSPGTVNVACAGGTWSQVFDATVFPDGPYTVYANLVDAAGNPAVQASRAFVKDTSAPTVAITSPAANSLVNIANQTSFAVGGTCSENGVNVVLSGAVATSTVCASNAWSINLNLTSNSDGAISVTANQTDASGNPATASTRSFVKDTIAPSAVSGFSMTTPTSGTTSAYSTAAVSGTYGTDAGSTTLSTNETIKLYLNDAGCASGNLVGTVSGTPGASFSLTTGSLAAGGDGLKTLYYTAADANGNTATCAATGLSYTYQSNPVVSFVSLGTTVKESAAQVGTALTLQRDVCGVTTVVPVTTVGVTAINGTNFTASTTNITFNPTDCGTKTVPASSFTIVSDGAKTGDLYFKATIGTITGGVAASTNQIATVNIIDAAYAGDYTFSQPLFTVNAGVNAATLTVQRGGSTAAAASVQVAFVDGSALGGTDYTTTTQTVNFGIGVDEQTVTVPIFTNSYNASFLAKLVNASAGTTVRNLSATKVRIMGDTGTCNTAGSPFGGGSGTTGSPYLICTLAQFEQIGTNLTSSFKLMADLSADGTLVAFGNLSGNFDGNEHSVDGFTGTGATLAYGLFTRIWSGSNFKAFNLLNVNVSNTGTNPSYTAGLAGELGNSTVMPALSNILVTGYVSTNVIGYSGLLGGVIYTGVSGTSTVSISNVITAGKVLNTNASSYTSGMIGMAYGNTGSTASFTYTNLFNLASAISNSNYTAGIIAFNQGRNTEVMTGCENRGYISGTSYVGGILGGDAFQNGSAPTENFTNSTNYGNVSASAGAVGGIIGTWTAYTTGTLSGLKNYGTITTGASGNAGGIIGTVPFANTNVALSIANSSNYGPVGSSGSHNGGLIGFISSSGSITGDTVTVNNSTNTGNISGDHAIGGLVGATNVTATGSAPTGHAVTITNSTSTGNITSTGASGTSGGLMGYFISNLATDATITATGNTTSGTVTCANSQCGGMFGQITLAGTKTSAITTSSSTMTINGLSLLGGLIGNSQQLSGATTLNITGSAYNGAITSSGGYSLGGAIGYASNATGTLLVSKVTAAGTYTSTAGNYVAGLIGIWDVSQNSAVSNVIQKSYSTATISTTQYAGGLLGEITADAHANTVTINDSYATGSITAGSGGIGGICGVAYDNSGNSTYLVFNLNRVYSTAVLSGAANGLTSYSYATGTNTASYWLQDTGINAAVFSDGNQRSNAAMQTQATYSGWDFATVWNPPSVYPTLR
jgi:hypothetical protein